MASTKVDYAALGTKVLELVGGEKNINSLAHCATRLRFNLRDRDLAQTAEIEKLDGVITVMKSAGLYQVVIGNNVVSAYDAIMARTSLGAGEGSVAADEEGNKGSPLNRFIAMISGVFSPVVWTLAAVGLIKAFLALFTVGIPLLDTESQTYLILAALGDGLMFFLPIVLSVSAAKHFKVNYASSMAIAAFLQTTTISGMYEAGDPVHLFGIPVVMAPYSYSVFPIIVAVWFQSLIEPRLNKVLPSWMRNFMTPTIVVLVVGLLTLTVIGPIINFATGLVAGALTWIWGPAPWLGGAIMGGFWQVFVMFGLHWGISPIMLEELAKNGYSLLFGPLPSAVVAQCAASLAVALRTKDKKLRDLALPTSISAFFSGVTEPLVYGVNLPLKRPFIFGIAGGAIGGAIAASGGSGATANVFASVLTLPAFLGVGNFALQLIGVAAAGISAFVVTFLFGMPKKGEATVAAAAVAPNLEPEASIIETRPADTKLVPADAQVVPANATVILPAEDAHTTDLVAAASGESMALSQVNDPVFSSGAMGQGVAIKPVDGNVYAPISGKVVTALDSGHAYGIKSDTGVEGLVHVGIDTVAMNGEGFTMHVHKGDAVQSGQPLVTFDRDAVAAAGYQDTVITIITNSGSFSTIQPLTDKNLTAGELAVIVER
ncbi:beta-glucoside-specific PTS transporter subunit IIABC [Rothia terrae]|uniref:beta-glucoside-specific PTS transporter subunit IIABC n=1 Tax=Rothia terrae TaxID=396015 RepID=UPI0028820A65|nr:beta-glucoside-specific PTS transporter subunit IIABC [Rothia terrae]MDT0189363.1 beta-glucoside-specific PTS transporter subunit IIABC [Rothia terrae]